ncbi:hypothetical protein BGZ52_011516 [Haplosporangium bisporale]|nr:hypothetical protein BGZ52_011516 [Haplosporangium bisporale]
MLYDKQDGEDGKKNYSVPYDFQCPIDTCLINISNSLSPTPSDFAELILQHLCEHDLKANNNMRSDRAPNQVRSTTIASGIDEPTTAPVPFATALAAHQSAISSLSQTRPPMRAIEIADDDGDYNGDDDDDGSMRMIEDETMVTAFSRRPYIDESEATRQHAQFQDSARVPISTSKFHKAAKRDRSDSYDDDFMQPKHRMPYKNRFEVTNTRAPVPPPVARELIEIHDTDSEASGEDYNLDDNCVSGRLERKRQRTMEHGTNMASCSDHQRSASFSKTFDTFATSQSSTSPNSNANSNTNSNNNTCSNWDKPARITM